jgi:hypothetical protein
LSGVAYGRYEEAYRAIHGALSGLMAPPPGRQITRNEFVWNVDGSLRSLAAYENDKLLFTIVFVFNVDGTLRSAART